MKPETRETKLPELPRKGMHPRQVESAVPGVPGLRVAVYPSGRRTYIYRYRNPVTKRKSAITLGEVT